MIPHFNITSTGKFSFSITFDENAESEYLLQFFGKTLIAEDPDFHFIETVDGFWGGLYSAHNVITGRYHSIGGCNQFCDAFSGLNSSHSCISCTDVGKDAFFLDDVYSDSGDPSSLIYINDIYAGGGNDLVDMTSERFSIEHEKAFTIHGGAGNDTLLGGNCDGYMLFGDAGNDSIDGGLKNDYLIGGIGNDTLAGNGGNDTFVFCKNFGSDTVTQTDSGTVTLWFSEGDASKWDAEKLTYTDGENTVKVSGVTEENVTLKFGDDGSEEFDKLKTKEAFSDTSHENVFQTNSADSATFSAEKTINVFGTTNSLAAFFCAEDGSTGEKSEIVSSSLIVSKTDPLKFEATEAAETIFFAEADGVWSGLYSAHNMTTGQYRSICGMNKFTDLYYAVDGADSILCLTNGGNDAFFLDDVYGKSYKDEAANSARCLNIDEIRACDGNDLVDLTSERFAESGKKINVRGGDGNDTIWGGSGNGSMLFGDAGNDWIDGGTGDDLIIGGTGNDSLFGNGGNDTFIFGVGNWGDDTVAQSAGSKVTLWFAEDDESKWDAETLVYADGENTVAVSGISAEDVTLKFGPDNSVLCRDLTIAGAFV